MICVTTRETNIVKNELDICVLVHNATLYDCTRYRIAKYHKFELAELKSHIS